MRTSSTSSSSAGGASGRVPVLDGRGCGPSDEDLVDRARAGSAAAFDLLYRRYFPLAVSGARRHLRNDRVGYAEDVAQVTFSAVHQALMRGHGPSGPFRSYLLLSVRREARRFMRRLDRDAGADSASAQLDVDAASDQVTLSLHVDRPIDGDDGIGAAYRDLPTRFQHVLWLSEVVGLPPGDVGSSLGLSPSAAAALSYRARAALRRSYERRESVS